MATSKDDGKTRKVMDVAKPGKTAPPASAKPIIVTNRPMLRRDPMMAPAGDGSDVDTTPEPEEKRPVSRVARTIKIMPLTNEGKAETPSTEKPAPAETPAAETPATPVRIAVVDKTVALEIGQEAVESLDQPAEATESTAKTLTDELTIEPSVEPERVHALPPAVSAEPAEEAQAPTAADTPAAPESTAETAEPEAETTEQPVADEVPMDDQATTPAESTEPSEEAAPEDSAATDGNTTPTESTEQPTDASTEESAATPGSTATDTQIAANEVNADAKRKVDAAATERQLEVEKIIRSKQYYLPIAMHEKQRGLTRSLIILALVIVVALVWLDLVLDAGIVHIPGVPALTHFFQ